MAKLPASVDDASIHPELRQAVRFMPRSLTGGGVQPAICQAGAAAGLDRIGGQAAVGCPRGKDAGGAGVSAV